jgi:hypothetical protein
MAQLINEAKRMQFLAGLIDESRLYGVNEELKDTLRKELEQKFGKDYFLKNGGLESDYEQWQNEKMQEHGYDAKNILSSISLEQTNSALEQVENIIASALSKMQKKDPKSPEYKKMEADVDSKLGLKLHFSVLGNMVYFVERNFMDGKYKNL